MDPLSAFCNMVAAAFNFGTEALRGQSLEQREKGWDRIFNFIDKVHERFPHDKGKS